MALIYSDLYTGRINIINSFANYVSCAAPSSNLIGTCATECVKEGDIFFFCIIP